MKEKFSFVLFNDFNFFEFIGIGLLQLFHTSLRDLDLI